MDAVAECAPPFDAVERGVGHSTAPKGRGRGIHPAI
jgi:hypothetical protein